MSKRMDGHRDGQQNFEGQAFLLSKFWIWGEFCSRKLSDIFFYRTDIHILASDISCDVTSSDVDHVTSLHIGVVSPTSDEIGDVASTSLVLIP